MDEVQDAEWVDVEPVEVPLANRIGTRQKIGMGITFRGSLRQQLLRSAKDPFLLPHDEREFTRLDYITAKLIQEGMRGNLEAIKVIATRLDGSPDANLTVHHTGNITHEHILTKAKETALLEAQQALTLLRANGDKTEGKVAV